MNREIVFVAGSPSPTSRSSFIAAALAAQVARAGLSARAFSIRDFDPADLILGHASAPAVQGFLQAVASSAAIVLSSPVYKATYAGGLKAVVDLIPPDPLVSKPALGIATTRLTTHGLEVDRGYRSLFTFFRARALDTLVVVDDELRLEGGQGRLVPLAQGRVDKAARELVAAAAPGRTLSVAP